MQNLTIRKKWQKTDVNKIISLKKQGTPLKIIGKEFGVTANAISKTLQRYCSEYTHPENRLSNFLDQPKEIQQIDAAIKWAIEYKMDFYRCEKKNLYYKNYRISEKFALLQINKKRLDLGLCPLFIKYW